ncbi:MOSC and FAD-binding oxidoreductase domain-containing protein [Streptomyces wuyuanensis]|uniref:Ferredoxin-NADP reductase n=1 Tax=Streptomyces wuyuanensis TaxID=1196353 RepID=A0A1G9YUC4_9ACTN|nr:MOSC and FAD-binding oxidoreductase domain-containing protein [Streptomyces wuyuanensis]SDN11956.1 Ferredoxin-NADP reductase [Streptomyces wuyuanensis]
MATLLSVNVGTPKDVSWQGRTVHTGAWKAPVRGARTVRRLNIDGDGQGDLAGHGGEMRAVLVYQSDSYCHWREQLGRDDLTFGIFGENFTVDGMPDDDVCIGDRYRIGEAEFEVTQPRVTCYRVGMRLGEPAMASLLVAHHRPGFYLRVLSEGRVEAGDAITLLRRGPEELTVADTDALLYLPDRDPALLRRALDIPALSPGWQKSFRELATAREPDQELAWPGFRTLRVARIVPETPAVSSIYLDSTDATPLPPARPGQYLSLRLATTGNAAPTVRSYSLSSAPGAGTYRISVKREPHGQVSSYLHSGLRPGDLVDVASPRGTFVLEDGTGPVLLVSAGIGATPVLAMLHRLATARDQRPVWWIHTARDRAHHVFADEAHALVARLAHGHECIYYTAPGAPATRPGEPRIRHGRMTAGSPAELGIPHDADAYLCGPAAFMHALESHLQEYGLAPERIHTEAFSALAAVNPGVTPTAAVRPHRPTGPPGTGPLVTFARSGITTPWSPARASLLELAEACDIPTRWSCRTGVCHTCVTPLVSGDVTYAPSPLEPPEAGSVLTCCSRPKGEVVLDL